VVIGRGPDARYPIALFPVRIETRFDAQNNLMIRVYPDEILADSHDATLTATEQQAGAQFWTESTSLGAATAWQHLLGLYAAPRAAWIVTATDPSALTPPTVRSNPWPRAVLAPLLPDRWTAIAFRGATKIAEATSSPVVLPLALTLSPDAPPGSNVDISGGLGLTIDPAIAWTVDYTRAVAAGMGFSMAVPAGTVVDRLLVVGLKTSITPDEGAAAMTALFNAHHYSDGFAFVPQGTPTNDSRDAPSGYPAPDPNGAMSFGVERGSSLATAGGDGVLWATALGLSTDVVAHVAGADRIEQQRAAAMNRALFPATWGYYLSTMMAPNVAETTIDAIESYVYDRVRARGPLPAFRVGVAPYGLLPVSSLTRWTTPTATGDQAPATTTKLLPILRAGRTLWSGQMAAAPHIGRSGDADADLVDVMSMDASARLIRMRRVLGESAQWNLLTMLGIEWGGWSNSEQAIASAVLGAAGINPFTAPAMRAVFADSTGVFAHGFAADGALSESAALDPNYIAWLQAASIDTLRTESFPSKPQALLYRLLRYALLQASWRIGRGILVDQSLATVGEVQEHELIAIAPGTESRLSTWQQLDRSVPAVTGALTLGHYLSPILPAEPPRPVPEGLTAYRDALSVLEPAPTAELDRLTSETLDLAAWRLDAWITSLYTDRLATMRAAQPTGVHVGAYAWVEGLSAATNGSAGYVHAPSMTHAAAAAVLLNGFLSNIGVETPGASPPYAIALTSARTRSARFVLDGVRDGQAVGAVFGYQVESGLHTQQADSLIDPLRQLYPLVANKVVDSGLPVDSIAARNVVDGLQLRTAWRTNAIPWGATGSGLPASGTLRTALETVLGQLDETVDAVADLLLAESIFQLVRGSTAGAAATLDTLAAGARPPDPDVARPLRGGADLTHRVAAILGGAPVPAGPGWSATLTPRATAEPRLDAWVGTLLGNPSAVRAQVTYNGATSDVSLDALGLRPLDVLALADQVTDANGAAEIDRRVAFAAHGDAPSPDGKPATVSYARASTWDRATVRTVTELLEQARAVAKLISGARVMQPQDCVRPADASGVTGTGLVTAELSARATAGESALGSALSEVTTAIATNTDAAFRAALRTASAFGVSGAYPVSGAGLDAGGTALTLAAQAATVASQLTSRQKAAAAAHLPASPTPTDAQLVAEATAILEAVFGADFVVVPGFTPPAASNMAAALSAAPALVGMAHAPVQWLQQASRVRDPLGRWRSVRMLAEASGAAPVGLDVVQLPVGASTRWGALPFATPADRQPGMLSLVLNRVAQTAATDPWYGLMLDEWVELIPTDTETTGLTFQYDDPGAEAAQSVLLAVPPVSGVTSWDLATVVDILNETLDLAKMRAVDGRLLGALGQLLPATYFTQNQNRDTITIEWLNAMRAEASVITGSV
jgi:hypothetical protein